MQKTKEEVFSLLQQVWKVWLLLFLVISSAIATFFYLFPTKVLDIKNSNWVLGNSPATLDLAQSTAGQNAFIGSGWSFPPGNLQNLGSSIHNSLLFSDTTPWFAYLVKIWSSFFGLPTGPLQFVGLQVLLAIVLLWVSVGLYIFWETKSLILGILCAFLVGTLPHFIIHWWAPSVMFQFLIVVALWLYRAFPTQSQKRKMSYWSGLFFISSMTHTYFVPMVGLIFLATIYDSLKKKEKLFEIFILSLSIGTSLVFGQFLSGGFSVGIAGSATGTQDYGSWSADLFTFFNSRGLSDFIPGFASLPSMEGFGYAGFGVLIMVICAGLFNFLDFYKKKKAPINKKNRKKKIPTSSLQIKRQTWKNVLFSCLILFCFAVGPSLTIFGKHFWLTQNHGVLQVASIFRSSGRFIWPTLIILPLWALIYIHKTWRNWSFAFLVVVILLQIFEFTPSIKGQKSAITQTLQDEPQLNPKITNAFHKAREVIYVPGYPSPATAPWRNYLIDFVRRGGNVVNFAYANRFNGKDMAASNRSVNSIISEGRIRSGTILILQKNSGIMIEQESEFIGTINDWDYYFIN